MVKASAQTAALARARARRLELERGRDERDRRVESVAAGVLVALERRAALETVLAELLAELGHGLATLQRDLSLEGAAELCGLDIGEARRLVRAVRLAEQTQDESGVRVPTGRRQDVAPRSGGATVFSGEARG